MTHHNEYLLTFVEPSFNIVQHSSTLEIEEIIGWKPGEKIDLGDLNFLYECFSPVEPIKVKNKRQKINFLTYRTKFDALYNHYKKWCISKSKPFHMEKEFWLEILHIFPEARVHIEYEEFTIKDRDGKDIRDKHGNAKTLKQKNKIIVNIRFVPEGVKKEPNHPS